MPIQIHELTPDDFDALLKFAQSLPQPPRPPLSPDLLADTVRRYPGLSLVATDNQQIAGAILMGASASPEYLLLLTPPQDGQDLRKLLVDKAMMKLASRGGRTCHISAQSQQAQPLWEMARWQDWPHLNADPAAPSPPAAAPVTPSAAADSDNAAA